MFFDFQNTHDESHPSGNYSFCGVHVDHKVTKEDETVSHITVVERPPAALHAADAHNFEVLPSSLQVSLCDHLNSTQAT